MSMIIESQYATIHARKPDIRLWYTASYNNWVAETVGANRQYAFGLMPEAALRALDTIMGKVGEPPGVRHE